MKKIFSFIILLFPFLGQAQNVGIGTTSPHPNAMLDVNGTNKGLLIPRGDAATRIALNSNTAKGLMVFDTITNTIWLHNGIGLSAGWNSLSNGSNYWVQQGALGSEIKNSNTGGLWSANATPVYTEFAVAPPVSGAGTRMMWMPNKSAFRLGTVSGNEWDTDSIGTWSTAMGFNAKAKGAASISLGTNTEATNYTSVAIGYGTKASGFISTAIGQSSEALGYASIAMGNFDTARGDFSTALGYNSKSTGYSSIAAGYNTKSSGIYSFASGTANNSRGYSSFAIGAYNDSINTISTSGFTSNSPLFYIGNGDDEATRHNAMVVYKNGNMVLKNPTTVDAEPTSFTVPISGTGTRMMWLPQKSAFRVGTAFSNFWDADSIGLGSFASGRYTNAPGSYSTAINFSTTARGTAATAMGYGTLATGNYATAMGSSSSAIGISSLAMGSVTNATGPSSTSMGNNTIASGGSSMAIGSYTNASGNNSAAMGSGTTASGNTSIAMGISTTASGITSTSMGNFTNASGDYSTAIGSNTIASGNTSIALGSNTNAMGDFSTTLGFGTRGTGAYSTAMGTATNAMAYSSLSVGSYNDSIISSNPTTWVSTDPLFYIGNGTNSANRHNAMVVYKNGNMVLKNPTTVTVDPVGFTVPISGAGTRMMWLPEKAAFRVGTVTGVNWNADSIGTASFAAGNNTRAKENYSFAMGNAAIAGGFASVAMGNQTTALGSNSIALGSLSNAIGLNSVALGKSNIALGSSSIALGDGTVASGLAGFTNGIGTVAAAYSSVASGRFNDSIASSNKTAWVDTDPLLMLGNGTSNAARSNALVVYKNGNTDINGFTQLGKTSEAAPSIKMKKLTGTSANTQGGLVAIPHGLNRAKILAVQVLLTYAAGVADIPGPYLDAAGYEYNWQVTINDINIYNKTGNSINILSKPVRILITYEE